MNRIVRYCIPVLFLSAAILAAQSKPAPAGHWEGSIKVPTGELKVVVDIDRDAKGNWVGDIDVPEQGVKDLPLGDVTVSAEAISFSMTAGPGNPKFNGKLSSEGTILAGDFSQGGGTVPFSLKRTGDAKVSLPPASPTLPDKFVGTWEGKLEAPGASMRIVFHLANKGGTAVGTIDSPDQGASGIPISLITVTGKALQVGVQIIAGEYKGNLGEDGKTITGTWSQGGASLNLALVKKQ